MIQLVPYVNFHDLNEDWILNQVKIAIEKVERGEMSFQELKDYVDNFFNNLDLQSEVHAKIESLIAEGRFQANLGVDYNAETKELTFSITFSD